jgi:exonuclease VII small subunit
MKDIMIEVLRKYNEKVIKSEGDKKLITRLYYTHNGKREYVEDFSYFANSNYMSEELLDSLSKGRTLTDELQKELNMYVFEGTIEDILELGGKQDDENYKNDYNEKIAQLYNEIKSLKLQKIELDKKIQEKQDMIDILIAVSK